MRYLAGALVVLAACSSTTVTVQATPDSTDQRICQAAEQVPFQGSLIKALVTDPQTPIQQQAAHVVDVFDNGGGAPVAEWDKLTQMCVDAGL